MLGWKIRGPKRPKIGDGEWVEDKVQVQGQVELQVEVEVRRTPDQDQDPNRQLSSTGCWCCGYWLLMKAS